MATRKDTKLPEIPDEIPLTQIQAERLSAMTSVPV